MFLLVGGVIMLVVSNVLAQNGEHRGHRGRNGAGNGNGNGMPLPPKLPDTYKDIFVAGQSGRPTLGTAGATCWARGGICVDIRECPSLQMDVGVAGCAWGYKVCCKVHKLGSPTVGVLRRYAIPIINNLDELGASLEIIALRNSMLMSDWQSKKLDSDEIHLNDLLHKK